MQVKELEITGFKSFVERVKLNFKPGITALVGPNGCGKSNIIDAIRWIMGEHNARQLRGARMEDLIFNGSETRKSTALAEVSMVLANANGNGNGNGNGHDHDSHASVLGGISEIMLTRRLHRSGESEYFINKVPCRLKDIVEVFLDSGVGTKSYSIMEQGKVDFILSLKPDERRVLIEEAAGISKYRTRKKEALSKIESTKSNLARIKDILNEIQIQMRGLDLQVKRLKRHRNISQEMRQIELQLASRRLHFLKIEKEQLEQTLTALRDEEQQLSTKRDSSEAVLQENKLNLTELNSSISHLQDEYYQAKEKTQREENSLSLNEKELQTIYEQQEKIALTIAALEQELASTENEQSSLRDQEAGLTGRIGGLESNFQSSQDSLSVAKTRQRELQASIEQENRLYFEQKHELAEIKNKILMSRRLHEELTLRIQRIENDKQSAVQAIAVLEENKAQLDLQLQEFRTLRTVQEEKILQTRGIIASCSAALQQKETEVNELYEICSAVNARLQSLQELQKNHEGYNPGVRTIMAQSEEAGNRHGIICLIADVLETESRYEKAIEAALEKRLQAVVVHTEEHALSAIEYLHAETGGRVSFIARNSRKMTTAAPEGATSLLSVVKIKIGFEEVIKELLGDILLTATLPAALSIWRDMQQKATIVTEYGDCIDDSGILTGGSGDVAGAGILKRNREIRESSEEVKIREAALADLRREKDALLQQLHDARQAFELLSAEKGRLDIACIEAEKNNEHTLRELFQERKRDEMLSSELSSCRGELDGHCEELAALQEKEISQQETLDLKASTLETQQAQIQQLAAELEIFESGHTDIQVRLASARKELENTISQLQKIEQQKQAARSKSAQLQAESTALTERALMITEDIGSAKTRLAESINKTRLLEADLEKRRSSAQILDEAVSNHETHMKELQKAWEEIGPMISKAEQNLAANGMHTDYLSKEVFDKYALSLDQLPPPDTGDDFNQDDAKARLEELQKRITSIGDVNLGAAREYEELEQRYQHLMNQEQDLLQAIDSLQKVIAKINRITRQKFLETYTTINDHFKELFPLLFNGGKAYMQLTNETDLLETGIEVFAQPPGKKLQSLDLLSGGERALTVIAIMFSIFLTKPTPFCLMDEIDAPLDDSNIGRFITHLKTMAEKSQFIIITHNKLSMQAANSLYGVTMEERGVSKIVSVELN
jgi:chromosome segregation protein